MSNNTLQPFASRFLLVGFLLITITLSLTNCEKWGHPENDKEISEHGDDDSHKKGKNCMNCHYTEGEGEGWFSIAGSVYGDHGEGTAYFYKDLNEAPIHEVEIDDEGNLYTTEYVDFSDGLYVTVISQDGETKQMGSKIYSGQCNLCHGVTQDIINF